MKKFRYTTRYRNATVEERWWMCVKKSNYCWSWLGAPIGKLWHKTFGFTDVKKYIPLEQA